jgi:PKD repeat protein
VFATAAFSDPDEGDVFSVTVDWGDGTVTNPAVTFTDGIGSISDSHTFATPGVYGMTLTVSDGAGGADTAEYDYAVIYDPAGRKIIASVRVVEGDAQDHLGVNVKLDKKTGEPKGHVRYNFDGSGFAEGFDATAIDYMLTFGSWGTTGGSGTVDGGTEVFEFLITAYEGKQDGSPDAFRIKIWTEGDPEDVIYDTQSGDGNFAFPNRQPTNGDIKVK